MSVYEAQKISNGFWRIVDAKKCCIYLIVGETRALLIDSGMCEEPLLPFVQTLTDKPITLALTHAHIDHMYRAEEFEMVYLHEREKASYTKRSQRLMDFGTIPFKLKKKKYPVNTYMTVQEGESIDLGGVQLQCIGAFGHTPGSMLLIDETHRAVICGDAVGSGSGVWMFLPDCISVREYENSLKETVAKLEDYKDFQYYGGHYEQDGGQYSYPLSYKTFVDMQELCSMVIHNAVRPIPITKLPIRLLKYYRNQTATMLTRNGKMK